MYLGIDLGSTNMKAALYDRQFHLIDRQSLPVQYIREGGFVEFDAKAYFRGLLGLLGKLIRENGIRQVTQMAFTGQAETLVVLDKDGEPLCNAISWMDERSAQQCKKLEAQFPPEVCQSVTGQMAVLPTWPATKILWLKEQAPDIFQKADKYLLLKDYIVYCLTGNMLGDMSVATFSFYFDIYNKCYWPQMLQAIGIGEEKLPPLAEPCTAAGPVKPEMLEQLGLTGETVVNIGTLDHFAGMIGTGNIAPGGITLSTGTVMALAAMTGKPAPKNCGIAMHYGFLPDTYVMLPVAESGGVSLEWFKRSCLPTTDYDTLNRELASRKPNDLLFLPYIVGTNAPEFDPGATGVFWGLRQEHDGVDMAGAVMEGVSFVLRKNCRQIASVSQAPTAIIATGGGAKSPVWCQLQADITGLPVHIPQEKEAACLGAAMIAAVGSGAFGTLEEAAGKLIVMEKTFTPHPTARLERKYRRFCALYRAALEIERVE